MPPPPDVHADPYCAAVNISSLNWRPAIKTSQLAILTLRQCPTAPKKSPAGGAGLSFGCLECRFEPSAARMRPRPAGSAHATPDRFALRSLLRTSEKFHAE